jgi:hypothetical protein
MQAFKLVAKFSRPHCAGQNLCLRRFSAATENFSVFPREREGNSYAVNWSLTEDGVVPTGDAFRNARIPLLTSRLPSKVDNGKVELQGPAYGGSFKVLEAGDSISHDEFNNKFSALQNHLSSGIEIFVEDAALGATSSARVGVRVVADSPVVALINRNLLVSPMRISKLLCSCFRDGAIYSLFPIVRFPPLLVLSTTALVSTDGTSTIGGQKLKFLGTEVLTTF